MFAYVAAGRLVQTEFTQVSETQIQFEVPNVAEVNHICVFMTGAEPLPPSQAAGVYVSWPPFERWSLLGVIHNDKPSAVFRIGRGVAGAASSAGGEPVHALLGISLEEGEELVARQQELAMARSGGALVTTSAANVPPVLRVVERPSDAVLGETCLRMLQHFYNYALSFADQEYIPVSVFTTWFDALKQRVERDPSYLYRDRR
eukprot:TRINITY_DN10745_c0_g1_i1.p1 TRINITY_DN10745_c0_g1~~TRINITY_DN10745_c0_g1_i1.p1  ORF type:complete len:203 (-),score=58.86 TRINITY_DN10745_c0_g1_i1:160-768(-)